jgi:N-acetylglucosamine kinase-like BadF-type ATPase
MLMNSYFLGVDIGNTKSHALIIDESGMATGFGMSGPGNHESLGTDGSIKILHDVVGKALQQAKIDISSVSGAGFGIAGFDWPSDRALMDQVINTLGMNSPYEVVNDGMIGLFAGAKKNWGVVVSSGTSSNARGRDQNGKIGRMTGNGMYFGETGGGTELVWKAVAEISRTWSKRGPKTTLSQIFVDHLGSKDVGDLLEGLARGRFEVNATDAPLVFDAASKGDAVAQDIIRWLGAGLADLAIGIINQLGFHDLEFEVVMAGSVYRGSALIAETMHEIIHKVAPGATLVRLDAPPVVGAVMLGMEQANIDYTPLRETIIKSSNNLLKKNEKH